MPGGLVIKIVENTTPVMIGAPQVTYLTIADFDVAANAILKSTGQAKGDLVGFSAASTPVRIPGPTVNGQALIADSAEPSGWKAGSVPGVGGKLIIAEFDGGGAAILPDTVKGLTWDLPDFTVSFWELLELENNNGYLELLICADTYANFPADPPDDMVGIHLGKTRPKLNNVAKNQATTPDWNDLVVENRKHLRIIASGYLGALTFTGAGLNDMKHGAASRFTGLANLNYRVEIDGTGSPNTFKWSDDGGATWDATLVAITGSDQLLNNGIYIRFGALTGHTATNRWDWTAYAITAKHAVLSVRGNTA